MEKELLERLIKEGNSTYKIAKLQGVVPNTITYWIGKLGINQLYKDNSKYRKYKLTISSFSKDELELFVKESNCLSECLNKMEIRRIGRNFSNLNKVLLNYNIDISHFDPYRTRIEKLLKFNKTREIPIELFLTEDNHCSRTSLKKRLYTCGLKNRNCELCGQGETWNGKKLSLILDHINGVFNDNRLENLRIVCPNCNATLDTHAGKNTKRRI